MRWIRFHRIRVVMLAVMFTIKNACEGCMRISMSGMEEWPSRLNDLAIDMTSQRIQILIKTKASFQVCAVGTLRTSLVDRPGSCVHAPVTGEMPTFREGLTALRARIRLFARMASSMSRQVRAAGKGHAALVARERFLARVYSMMTFEIRNTGKVSVTCITGVWFQPRMAGESMAGQ